MKSVRMKDIAQDLGISMITVSKALRNRPDISVATRDRILKRAKELNYRPNFTARALATGRTHLIGLVVPDLVHSFYSEVGKGLAGVLRKSGYCLVISSSEENPEVEKQVIDQLIERRVDALLIASTQQSPEVFQRIEESGIPYVLIDRQITGLRASFVGVDDELIGCIATEHLIDIGCQRIAHIGGDHISPARGRLAGYKQALAKHRMLLDGNAVVLNDTLDKSATGAGYDSAKKLLHQHPRPDGIFCFSDVFAIGAMAAILDAGLRIPQDVALIGCSNLHYAPFLQMPLSSVDQQSVAIGQRAAKLAIRMIKSKRQKGPETILLQPRLVVRESTKRTTSAPPPAAPATSSLSRPLDLSPVVGRTGAISRIG
jgi:LacI family transcriptional regulator